MADTTATKAVASPLAGFQQRYEALNPEQRRAVDTIDGVVMVLAGPGTGKTQLLAMRIAAILERTQLDPQNILCVTFTDSAVVALRRRLESIIGSVALRLQIHTFHSFCNAIIQDNPEYFVRARELAPLSDVEHVHLFEQLVDGLPGTSPLKPFGNPYLYLSDISRNIKQLKQEDVTPDALAAFLDELAAFIPQAEPVVAKLAAYKPSERTDEHCRTAAASLVEHRSAYARLGWHFDYVAEQLAAFEEAVAAAPNKRAAGTARTQFKRELVTWLARLQNQLPRQRELVKIYRRYEKQLAKRGRYDYEDMILFVVKALREHDQLLARYQEQLQYFLVDEYQDTNGAQNELLVTLAEFRPAGQQTWDAPNLFVVGDDKQSIYRFQGASLANLLDLYQRYQENITVVSLVENYRSSQLILDASHALIQHSAERLEARIPNVSTALVAAAAGRGVPITLQTYADAEAERHGIARAIAALIADGTAPSAIAVLTRRNADARSLLPALQAAGVPAQVMASENALHAVPVRQLLELLRVAAGDVTDRRIWEIVHFACFALDPLDIVKVQTAARRLGRSLLAVMSSPDHLAVAGVTGKQLPAVAKQVAAWQATAANETLPNVVAHIIHDSKLLSYYVADRGRAEVCDLLYTIFAEAKALASDTSGAGLPDLLEQLALIQQYGLNLRTPEPRAGAEAVSLMTAHRAKGLEFDQVFIAGATARRWDAKRLAQRLPLPRGLEQQEPTSEDRVDDERRLFYVAVTRARTQVTVTYAETSDSGRAQLPSRFLTELPATMVNGRTMLSWPAQRQADQVAQLTAAATPAESDLVSHVRGLLTDYVLSVTHLNNYLRCPRLFYYRNVLHAPAVKTKHLAFGTAVHNALRDVREAHGAGQAVSAKLLVERFEHHLAGEILSPADRRDSLSLGQSVLRAYYKKYAPAWQQNVLLEYSFAGHHVRVGNQQIPLTGMLDKIEVIDEQAKQVSVTDYKTGSPDGKSKALGPDGEYYRQLVFYQLLCDASKQFDYTMVSGEVDFIQPRRTGAFVRRRYTIAPEETAKLTETIEQVWDDIQQLKFLEPDPAALCGECEYCQLFDHSTR